MKGKISITVKNDRVKYDLELRRNITVIKGDSATGKTTLLEMIREYNLLGRESGVELSCEYNCALIEGSTWKNQLSFLSQSIVFIDEGNRFMSSKEFASTIKETDNYYVLVTRESIATLPYSIEEIYGIRENGKYAGLSQTYHEIYQIYSKCNIKNKISPSIVITEDSNSGFQFFQNVCLKGKIECVSSSGKSNVKKEMLKYRNQEVLVIADGAAFGPEMEKTQQLLKQYSNFSLYLPESFEWLILMSDCINDNEIKRMSENWSQYIESRKYFSWEQFFCALLIQKTQGTYLQYNKKTINAAFLDKSIEKKILNYIKMIDFGKGE